MVEANQFEAWLLKLYFEIPCFIGKLSKRHVQTELQEQYQYFYVQSVIGLEIDVRKEIPE